MDGYWKGYGSAGKQQGPISIPNECFKFLDSLLVMIDKRNIIPEMKSPQLNLIQSKQLKTLSQKIKQVVLRLQKLFLEPNKQTKDLSMPVKQKQDSFLAFLNQCMASRKETKYINQRASQICYSQKNKKQLLALIEKMTKDNETIKQIKNDLKIGLQSCTGKVKDILQQNKKAKEFQDIFYQHETRIWQLFKYTQNQSKKETFNSNNNKKDSQKQLQTYVKLDEMRIFMRSLDQKLKLYRDQKATKWEQRLAQPTDRLLNELANSAINARKICDRMKNKIKLTHSIGKVSAENISKINNTNAILGEIEKNLGNYETLFEIYGNFVNQINNLSFIHPNSQTRLQQRLKAYIKDLQQLENKIKIYESQNIFPFKNEPVKSKDQNQMKMISNQQAQQNKRLIAQIEKHKSMIRTIQKENEENKQKRESYIKQILQKTQSITQQKLQNLQYYNLQKAKLQRLQQQYSTNQKVINSLKTNEQQSLKKLRQLNDQLQRVKKQSEQKQKNYYSTILSIKQAEARITNQKTALLQQLRSLKAQISKLNHRFKQEKEQFKDNLSKGVMCFVDHTNQKNSLLLRKIDILQKRINSIVGFLEIQKDKIQKTKIQIQILKSTANQLNKTNQQALRNFQKQKQQRLKLIGYISTLNSFSTDQRIDAKAKQLQMEKRNNEINDYNRKLQQQNIEKEQLIKRKQFQTQGLLQQIDILQIKIKTIIGQNQIYHQHKKIEVQNLNQQISALNISIQKINSDNKSIKNQQSQIEKKKLQISAQIQIMVADEDLYVQNKQKQEQQITDLKDKIKIINTDKQICIQDNQLKIDNLQKQIYNFQNQRQRFIAENKILISNQLLKNENKDLQILELKRQIQLINTDKQHFIQDGQLKIDDLKRQIDNLKNKIKQIIAENEIFISNQQLKNDNKDKQILNLKKQIQLITTDKQSCIQTNKLKFDNLQKQIVNFKDKIQLMQAEKQIIKKQKYLYTDKQKDQISQLNARIQQRQTQNQNLKQRIIEINNEQQEQSKQPPLKHSNISFDSQSWFCDNQQTLITAKSLIKQISHINRKLVKNATLLYRYSPQNKLDWNHFVNKTNVLIIIKTATNKMIAVYTLAPLMKPGGPQYTGDEKAFIFESDLNGKDQCFYPMLEGKKANACYGNIVSIGKSDLRFGLKDDVLEGNFGYSGSYFDTKVKIPQLLGSNKESKVKMLTYEIYEVTLDQNTMRGKYGKDVRVRQEYYLNAIQESEGEKKSLRQKIDELTTEATEKHKLIEALKIEIHQITEHQKASIKAIQQKLEKRNLQFKDLKQNLSKQNADKVDLLQQKIKCQSRIEDLSKQLEQEKATSSLYQQKLKQKEVSIQQINKQIDSLKIKNEEIVLDASCKQKQIQQLKLTVDSLQIQIQVAQQHKKYLSQDVSSSKSTETKQSVSQQLMSSKSSQEFSQNIYRINTKKYSQLAQQYKIDALLVAHISTLFVNQLLNEQFEMKLRLVNFIESFRKSPISNTKLIYKYDPNNLTTFHKYIDDTKNLVLVVKTVSGVFLATYYSGKYTKGELLTSASLLMTLTYNNSFELYNAITNPQVQRAFRGMVYDDFFLIFGNAELRIRANEKIIFSNFGIGNSFFNPRGKKVHDLIGQGQKREIEFVSYEIFEVSFFDEE